MSRFISLMYHNLEDEPANNYSITPAVFQQQLDWLISEGYVVEGLPDLEQRLLRRRGIPARYVVMTFDDGHRSNLHAAEILCRAGAQATFFLTRDFCRQRPDFLRDSEIRELASLCSIGSHGVTHAPLSRISDEHVRAELAESKAWLEAVLGAPITTFSAPGGFINQNVLRQAIRLGYTLAGNSVDWWNEPPTVASRRLVNRVAIRQGMPLSVFKRVVEQDSTVLLQRRLRAGTLEVAKRVMPLQQYDQLSRAFYRLRAEVSNKFSG